LIREYTETFLLRVSVEISAHPEKTELAAVKEKVQITMTNFEEMWAKKKGVEVDLREYETGFKPFVDSIEEPKGRF